MTAPNRRMFWLLARAQRRVAAAADASLAELGLTSTQAGALFCFHDDGLLIGELAQALDLAQSASSGLAQRLEDAGLVARETEEGDGRAVRLVLTPGGRRKRDEAARRVVPANKRTIEGFSEHEIDVVVRWLNHVAHGAPPPKKAKNANSKRKEKT